MSSWAYDGPLALLLWAGHFASKTATTVGRGVAERRCSSLRGRRRRSRCLAHGDRRPTHGLARGSAHPSTSLTSSSSLCFSRARPASSWHEHGGSPRHDTARRSPRSAVLEPRPRHNGTTWLGTRVSSCPACRAPPCPCPCRAARLDNYTRYTREMLCGRVFFQDILTSRRIYLRSKYGAIHRRGFQNLAPP